MKALRFDGALRLTDMDPPEPGPGEALIRVEMAGICNTDQELVKGYMGFQGVLGHEFVGAVEQAGNSHLVGKRVVGEINCACHKCRYCQMEMPRHCMNRSVLGILGRDGAFAEYVTLPEENLHIVPPGMPEETAVFTEPVAAAFRIPEQIAIQGHERIIVLGDGKLGQLIAQVLRLYAADVTAVGKRPWKLEKLAARGVATAEADAPIEGGADIVVEVTGTAKGLARALELVRPEGTVVLKTTVAGETTLNMSLPVIHETRIVGSRCGPFKPALEALALGNVDVAPLISARYPLEEGVEAFERASAPDTLKVLLEVGWETRGGRAP